jgi:hypothetical protein
MRKRHIFIFFQSGGVCERKFSRMAAWPKSIQLMAYKTKCVAKSVKSFLRLSHTPRHVERMRALSSQNDFFIYTESHMRNVCALQFSVASCVAKFRHASLGERRPLRPIVVHCHLPALQILSPRVVYIYEMHVTDTPLAEWCIVCCVLDSLSQRAVTRKINKINTRSADSPAPRLNGCTNKPYAHVKCIIFPCVWRTL